MPGAGHHDVGLLVERHEHSEEGLGHVGKKEVVGTNEAHHRAATAHRLPRPLEARALTAHLARRPAPHPALRTALLYELVPRDRLPPWLRIPIGKRHDTISAHWSASKTLRSGRNGRSLVTSAQDQRGHRARDETRLPGAERHLGSGHLTLVG